MNDLGETPLCLLMIQLTALYFPLGFHYRTNRMIDPRMPVMTKAVWHSRQFFGPARKFREIHTHSRE